MNKYKIYLHTNSHLKTHFLHINYIIIFTLIINKDKIYSHLNLYLKYETKHI